MRPEWFPIADIPFARMWTDDEFWFPHLLAQRPFRGDFAFAADQITLVRCDIQLL